MQSKHLSFVLIALIFSLCAAGPVAAQPNATEIDSYSLTLAELELSFPDGSTDHFFMSGPATMHVFFEGPNEGNANDGDRNGLDEVNTELVELNLVGTSMTMGPVNLSLSPEFPTEGQLEEKTNQLAGRLDLPPFSATGMADSDLGLYVAMNLMGQDYHNVSPLDLTGVFHHKPATAGDVLLGQQSVVLMDASGQPSGIELRVIRWWLHALIEVDESTDAVLEIDLRDPNGSLLEISASGLMRQHVFFEGDVEGSAVDDDGNGLDEVSVQIVDLDLQGFEPTLGTVQIGLHPVQGSQGEIEEQFNAVPGTLDLPPFQPSGPADSFFDVFVEVDAGGETLRNEDPIRIVGPISHKPPGPGDSLSGNQHVVLVDATGQPSGFTVESTQLRYSRIVEIDTYQSARFDFQLDFPTGPEVVATHGSMTMHVFFEGAVEGSAVDDDSNSLDEVNTEVVQLDLAGTSTTVGSIQLSLYPGIPSLGEIEEQTNTVPSTLEVEPFVVGGTAFSTLDMVLRLRMMGHVYYTEQPLHLEGLLTHKPARQGDVHHGMGNPVQLFDLRTGQPVDIYISLRDAWFNGPATAVEDGSVPSPSELELHVWPNPLNPQAVISYRVPRSGAVSLVVFDLRGRRVRSLFDGVRETGEYRVVWDGRDDAAATAASGAYLIRLTVDGVVETRKVSIVW